MTSELNAFEALATVPGWDPAKAEIEELKGGLTNRVYFVRQGDQECVLRLNAPHTGAFGLDRSCEVEILERAGQSGLAPQILHADEQAGILVTEYLRGTVWQHTDLDNDQNVEALAGLLQSVHKLPTCDFRINLSIVSRKYEQYLQQRQGLHAFASTCVDIIERIPARADVTCCHNDIVAANVVDVGSLKLIDWEYACDNDPMFDLASAIGYHNFDQRRTGILLSAYAGGADGELTIRLEEQVRAYDAIQWLWLATRHLVSPSREQAKRLEELQQRIR